MIKKQEYVEYLLSTPNNYTCTNMAEHKRNLSHDVVNDFLRQSRFSSTDLWKLVEPHIEDSASSWMANRRLSQRIQATDWFGKMSMPQSACSA